MSGELRGKRLRLSEISNSLECSVSVNGNSRWGVVEFTDDGEISDGIYVASFNGFICISQIAHFRFHQSPSIVYNPITREKFRLPEFDQSLQFKFGSEFRCGFGLDKMSNRYKLILDFYLNSVEHYFYIDSQQCVLPILTVGVDDSWRMVDLPCEILQFFRKRKRGGFFFNTGFHWLFADNKFSVEGILTLDIITEKFQTTLFSPPLHIDHHYKKLVPIQLGNSLGLLHQNRSRDGNNDCQSKVIEIWKILGAKPDGSCDYQFKTLNFPNDQYNTPFDKMFRFELLAVLSNGDFLFNPWDYFGHHLVLYDQQKDEPSYFVDMGIRVCGNYKYVAIGTFLPTLKSISLGGH